MIKYYTEKVNNDGLEIAITHFLHLFGIPAHIKGHRYLRDAVVMAINDPNTVDLITKYIYPEIARMYNTTSSRVERAMRHALDVAWSRGMDSPLTNAMFPAKISKPKNSEFIAELSSYIIINRSKQETAISLVRGLSKAEGLD